MYIGLINPLNHNSIKGGTMENVIYYRDYIRKITEAIRKAPYQGKRYARLNSILDRIIDWELANLD